MTQVEIIVRMEILRAVNMKFTVLYDGQPNRSLEK